jgi:hypothetical protein
MHAAVSWAFGDSAATVGNLLLAVTLGAGVYVFVVGAMWLASRRPANSAETYVYEAVAGFFGSRRHSA